MVVIFEQDTRRHNGRRWAWKPGFFRSVFDGKRTWRVWWGLWSISVYRSPGLREFFRHVEAGRSGWRVANTEAFRPDDDRCICHRCIEENDIRDPGSPFLLSSTRMILCPKCGNKRCPHASDHRLECTGSNAVGQKGSIFK